VRELTPTARLVHLVLEDADEGLTYRELATETGASHRAVKSAVADLRDVERVVSVPADDGKFEKVHYLRP